MRFRSGSAERPRIWRGIVSVSLMSINNMILFLIDSKQLFPEYNLSTRAEFIA